MANLIVAKNLKKNLQLTLIAVVLLVRVLILVVQLVHVQIVRALQLIAQVLLEELPIVVVVVNK